MDPPQLFVREAGGGPYAGLLRHRGHGQLHQTAQPPGMRTHVTLKVNDFVYKFWPFYSSLRHDHAEESLMSVHAYFMTTFLVPGSGRWLIS